MREGHTHTDLFSFFRQLSLSYDLILLTLFKPFREHVGTIRILQIELGVQVA
jgi:hypothetical protein